MRDRWMIVFGLVLFLALITFPFWYGLRAAGTKEPPKLELPAGETKCVEKKEYMRANHMNLLVQWRDAVVREGKTTYTSSAYGDKYEMSLTRTCMKCHVNRIKFCDQCHNYANVQPYCWDCHLEPGGIRIK